MFVIGKQVAVVDHAFALDVQNLSVVVSVLNRVGAVAVFAEEPVLVCIVVVGDEHVIAAAGIGCHLQTGLAFRRNGVDALGQIRRVGDGGDGFRQRLAARAGSHARTRSGSCRRFCDCCGGLEITGVICQIMPSMAERIRYAGNRGIVDDRIIPADTDFLRVVTLCNVQTVPASFQTDKPVPAAVFAADNNYIAGADVCGTGEICAGFRRIITKTILYIIGTICAALRTTIWRELRSGIPTPIYTVCKTTIVDKTINHRHTG